MSQNFQTAHDIIERLRKAHATELATLERSLAADTRKTVKDALVRARKRVEAERAEQARVQALYDFDQAFGASCVLGLDEVGRGPVAGPLAVGGVVLEPSYIIPCLNDSKQVKEHDREAIAADIAEHARASTVCFIEAEEIDALGMSAAIRKAFSTAIQNIEAQGFIPDLILLDGNPLHLDEREQNVVKGDAKSASIAAASILAKVQRDHLMRACAIQYPVYGFEYNKGYASQDHIQAIKEHGLCPLHRKSFCSAFLQESLF